MYENKTLCSDGGAILGDMPEDEKEPVDPDPDAGGTTTDSSIIFEVIPKQ